jgi:hypothetical protein
MFLDVLFDVIPTTFIIAEQITTSVEDMQPLAEGFRAPRTEVDF